MVCPRVARALLLPARRLSLARVRRFVHRADGESISRNGNATGPEAIERLPRGLVPEPAPGKRRKHLTTNIVIELAGDRATVVSTFLVVRDSEAGPVISVAGTYDNTVVRTAEGWKFKSRRLSHDISGESGLTATNAAAS